MAQNNGDLRAMVRAVYDLQMLRIQQGNRIVANFKVKLGQLPSAAEETLDDTSKALLAKFRSKQKLLTDAVIAHSEENDFLKDDDEPDNQPATGDEVADDPTDKKAKADKAANGAASLLLEHQYKQIAAEGIPTYKRFKGTPIISTWGELCLIVSYKEMYKNETEQFSRLEKVLMEFPFYTRWLKGVKGIGPAMAAVIISELDPSRAPYASSFWAYCGLDVGPDGRGRGKYAEHLIDVEYTDKEGKLQVKKSITFKPFIKTKLMGVVSGSFLRSKSPYADLYYNYRQRLENNITHVNKKKAHKHYMALRYMVKLFLVDCWVNWRAIEGLSVSPPYHVSHLGRDDHGLEDKLFAAYGIRYTWPDVTDPLHQPMKRD